ncbi:MAG TPA: hypothetical protein DEG28_09295 [Porphyromonadaceae bacterium]|nr:hypothetical protein [Porphyromonadaceae bacterium]
MYCSKKRKLMKIIKYYFALVMLCLLSACIDSRDDIYNELPDIEIANLESVPSEVLYNEVLYIDPTVKYGDSQDKEAFDFLWYKGVGSSLKLLSEEPVLEQKMDSLGTWNIYLKIIHKTTQLSSLATLSVKVNSQTERGWYVLKENAEGNTDLDFFKTAEDGKITPDAMADLIGRENALKGVPKGIMFTNNFRWKSPGSTSFTTYINTLIPFSEKEVGALRINDSKLMETTDNLFFEKSVDASYGFSGGIGAPQQALLLNNGNAHLMQAGMQAFLPAVFGDYALSPHFTLSNAYGSYILGFDELSESFIYVKLLSSSIFPFPQKQLENSRLSISSNNMKGRISFLENTDGSLNPQNTSYAQRAYAIFHENSRNDRSLLLGLDLAQIDAGQTTYGSAQFNPIMTADTLNYRVYPEIEKSEIFTLHKNYPILYFAYGNKIGSYSIEMIEQNRYKKEILAYPSEEKISYMHFIECMFDTNSFSYLVVATYTADGNYKIYRYKIAGNDVTQVGSPLTGRGKVKTIRYIAPSSSIMFYLYRYY